MADYAGVMAAILYCARRYRLKAMAIGDEVAGRAPIGCFLAGWPISLMVNCMGE